LADRGQKTPSRARRLRSAKRWLAKYRGKDLVRGYRKRFGVSRVCAILELRMLGVAIPDSRLEQARKDEQDRAALRARRSQKRRALNASGDSDETFAFIAGYTEGGAPYGITWEEVEALDGWPETPPGPFRPARGKARDVPRVNGIPVMDDDESLPF
jgi:hypothetical protein